MRPRSRAAEGSARDRTPAHHRKAKTSKRFHECYEAVTSLPAGQPGKSHVKINPARHGDTTVNMSVGSGYRVTKDGHEPKHTLDPHVAAVALFWRRLDVDGLK